MLSILPESHYQQQKLNFNRNGLKPYFSTDFDAFYFSHFVTRWRYFRSSIYCQIRRVAASRLFVYEHQVPRSNKRGDIHCKNKGIQVCYSGCVYTEGGQCRDTADSIIVSLISLLSIKYCLIGHLTIICRI